MRFTSTLSEDILFAALDATSLLSAEKQEVGGRGARSAHSSGVPHRHPTNMQCPRSWQFLLSYETDRLHCYSGASHTGLISKSAVVSDVGLLAEDFTSVPGFQQVSLEDILAMSLA